MKRTAIDQGQPFDFGRTAADYARYRDIYPASLYARLLHFGIGRAGSEVLDLGTGTGVIPRFMVQYGAHFTGIDISPEQIDAARQLSAGLPIDYLVTPAEQTPFAPHAFDAVTACQCFHYFDRPRLLRELQRLLKPDGRFCKIFMEWLPREDQVIAATEQLVLTYNPAWSGGGYQVDDYRLPDWTEEVLELETLHRYRETLPFSVDGWCGRIRTCRGIGASLPPEKVAAFDRDLRQLLRQFTADTLQLRHEIQIEIFRFRPSP